MFRHIINNLQTIHSAGVVHRDMKPHNILINTEDNKNKIYIIDFGLARVVKKSNKEVYIMNKNTGFAGTIMYASIRAH